MVTTETTDVEMKNADSPPEAGDNKRDVDLQSCLDIREQTRQIEKAVTSKENRFISRVLRSLPTTRRKLNGVVFRSLVNQLYPQAEREALLCYIEEVAGGSDADSGTRSRSAVKSPLPEIDGYIHLLVLVHLIDTNKLEEAGRCSQVGYCLVLSVFEPLV